MCFGVMMLVVVVCVCVCLCHHLKHSIGGKINSARKQHEVRSERGIHKGWTHSRTNLCWSFSSRQFVVVTLTDEVVLLLLLLMVLVTLTTVEVVHKCFSKQKTSRRRSLVLTFDLLVTMFAHTRPVT